jgi:hypothetical protein
MITVRLTLNEHHSLKLWLSAAVMGYGVAQALHPHEDKIKACHRALERVRESHDAQVLPRINAHWRSPNAHLIGTSELRLSKSTVMALDEYATEAVHVVCASAVGKPGFVERALLKIRMEAQKCRQS